MIEPADSRGVDAGLPEGWSLGRRRFALGLLTMSAVLNLVDRQVITLLIEPLKHEFGLSDTQVGLLTGSVFALCYATVALPMARLLDMGVRRNIFAFCVALWSLGTMLAGAATSFGWLLATRLGVAVGESAAGPAQHSMASDLYPGARLTMPLGVINMGSALGVALSSLLGGWLVQEYGWRATFVIVGAPGLLLALMIRLAVPEPPRRSVEGQTVATQKEPLGKVVKHLWSLRTYRCILLGVAGSGFSGTALFAWAPSFLIRVHHMRPAEVGLWFGLAAAAGLGTASLAAGRLGTILGSRDLRWYLRLGAIFDFLAVPAGLLIAWSPNAPTAIFGLFVYMFCTTVHVAPSGAMVQFLALPRMRGMAASGSSFMQVIAGAGLGPVVLGLLNDSFRATHGVEGFRLSLSLIVIGIAIGGVALLVANRWAPKEYARVKALEAAVAEPA